MGLGTANSSGAFKPIFKRSTDVCRQDFPIGKLNNAPSIIAVTVFGKIGIDGLLSKCDDSVHLLLGIRQARFYSQVKASNVDVVDSHVDKYSS